MDFIERINLLFNKYVNLIHLRKVGVNVEKEIDEHRRAIMEIFNFKISSEIYEEIFSRFESTMENMRSQNNFMVFYILIKEYRVELVRDIRDLKQQGNDKINSLIDLINYYINEIYQLESMKNKSLEKYNAVFNNLEFGQKITYKLAAGEFPFLNIPFIGMVFLDFFSIPIMIAMVSFDNMEYISIPLLILVLSGLLLILNTVYECSSELRMAYETQKRAKNSFLHQKQALNAMKLRLEEAKSKAKMEPEFVSLKSLELLEIFSQLKDINLETSADIIMSQVVLSKSKSI